MADKGNILITGAGSGIGRASALRMARGMHVIAADLNVDSAAETVSMIEADGGTINERRKLSINGQMSVAVAVKRDGTLVGVPQVRLSGIPVEEEREPVAPLHVVVQPVVEVAHVEGLAERRPF